MGLRSNPFIVLSIAITLIVAAPVYTWLIVLLWRRNERVEAKCYEAMAMISPNDREKTRALVRGTMGICVSGWGLAGCGIVILVEYLEAWSRGIPTLLLVLNMVSPLLVLFGGLVLEFAIVSYNVPKFAVPPHMRGDMGMQEVRRMRAKNS